MSRFVSRREVGRFPRLPLKGFIDLTYRCNNDCRHCWLWIPADSPEKSRELSAAEIRRIAGEARRLGCRRWTISGGEPLLREDFAEVFDALTSGSAGYTLITNGTLITPAVARLLKRRGTKLIALYGATAAVHDHVTRSPGSFEALRRGVAYLREAGTGFTVQVVPMKDNFHQYREIVRLAESWSPSWRVGAAWLYLSADGNAEKNREILAQRLAPGTVLELDPFYAPDIGDLDEEQPGCAGTADGSLYAECIASRRDFHIDPYGGMSFCCFAKDPALRCDLRSMRFEQAWDECLPAMAGRVSAGPGYFENCGACALRKDCRWCPVYAFLEHRDHSAKVDYLCAAARAVRDSKADWARTHRRFYRAAGLTVRVDSDLPFEETTFRPKFELFRTPGPVDGSDATISIHHHFSLPNLEGEDLGKEVYRRPPWAVFRKGRTWIYLGIYPEPADGRIHRLIIVSDDHTRAHVFHPSADLFRDGGHDSLMLLSSDQIFLARALPGLGGAYVHAAGVDLRGKGFLFAGPSEAGKSTIVKMLRDRAKILCDDRMIVRRSPSGFDIHGTWSHGEVPLVSPDSAPLRGVFFLRQARENKVERIAGAEAVLRDFLPRLVRPLLTADWWETLLALAGEMAGTVPFYDLYFDRSGEVVGVLEELAR